MRAKSLSPTRRRLLAAAAGAGLLLAPSVAAGDARSNLPSGTDASQTSTAKPGEIRPFRVNVPAEDLADLRRRIAATRWPDRETVSDQSQGIQLAKLQELVRHWGTAYDWRKAEAKLNALPQFVTNIDGLDIHFIHVRSTHANALPVIMTHGWPGSVFELLKVVGPLTDPTAHGGQRRGRVRPRVSLDARLRLFRQADRPPAGAPSASRRAWAELMQRLGYTRYVAQGGDWGSPVSSAMARQAPAGLLGIHINLPAAVPAGCGEGDRTRVGLRQQDFPRRNARPSTPSARPPRWTRSYAAMHGHAAADHRLRLDGLAGRPRRVDSRAPGLRAMDLQQQRSREVPPRTRCSTTSRCTG